MIRNGCESTTTECLARGLRVIRAVTCGAVLVLFSGCTTGTSGSAKSGLFDRFDKKEKASGTAALKPVVVCPTCSVPVGVAANGAQAADPPVPPIPGSTVNAEAQDNVAGNTQQAAVGMSSQPAEHMQAMPSIPQVPPEGAVAHGMAPNAITGARQPNAQLTWEQSQAVHLRNQQAMQSPATQMAPVNQTAAAEGMMPVQIPSQQAACAPGTTAAKSFAGQWYDSAQPVSSNDGGVCPPTPVQAELRNCQDEVARMRSEFAQMQASQEKANQAAQILAVNQQRLEQQNRELQEAQKRMDQADIEQLDALNELAEEVLPDDATPYQPQPQASNPAKSPIRTASRSRVQSAGRPQPRRVILPSVDE